MIQLCHAENTKTIKPFFLHRSRLPVKTFLHAYYSHINYFKLQGTVFTSGTRLHIKKFRECSKRLQIMLVDGTQISSYKFPELQTTMLRYGVQRHSDDNA
jgi:hypothetical protein